MLHCRHDCDGESRGTVVLRQRLIFLFGWAVVTHPNTVGQECPTYIASGDIALVPV